MRPTPVSDTRISRLPIFSKDTFSPELAVNIEQMLTSQNFDLVIASQINMAAYGKYFNQIPALFEEAEVGVLFEQYKKSTTPVKRFRYGLTWYKHKRFIILDRRRRHFPSFRRNFLISIQPIIIADSLIPREEID